MSEPTCCAIVDVETTGLSAATDKLLEVAFLIVTPDFSNVVDEINILLPVDPVEVYSLCDPFVQKMHTENGLWQDLHEQTTKEPFTSEQVEEYLLQWLAQYGIAPNAKTSPLGFNPAFDRGFLEVHLPKVGKCLSHRHRDARSVLEFLKPFGYVEERRDKTSHRALSDCYEVLKAYRSFSEWMHARITGFGG